MASEFNIKLAQLVKQYPAIYDIMNPAYRKEDVKSKAWKCIADELNIPQAKCMIKWKSLKHQYVKCKKEDNAAWDMLQFMEFLDESSTKTKGRKKKSTPLVAEAKAPAVQDVPEEEAMDIEPKEEDKPVEMPAPSSMPGTQVEEAEETKPKSPRRTLRGGRRASGRHFEVQDDTEQNTKVNGSTAIPEPATKAKRASPKAADKEPVVVLNSNAVTQFQRDSKTQEQGTKLPPTPSKTPGKGRKSVRLSLVAEEVPPKQEEVDLPEVPPKRETRKRGRPSTIAEEPLPHREEPVPAEAETGHAEEPAEDRSTELVEEASHAKDEAFAKLVLEKLAKLPPSIKPSIKASILGLLDDAAK